MGKPPLFTNAAACGNGREIGARPLANGSTMFRVWAPRANDVAVVLTDRQGMAATLQPEGDGYFSGAVKGIGDGELYRYLLDGVTQRPDPASRFQPEGVHGPSQVVDPGKFTWSDDGWRGIPLEEQIIYELHVGVFTPEGTFDGIICRLDYLCELGVTALELMPVSQFPGRRNWGYDGVYPFAPQNSYGGPDGLKRLVNACHNRGLTVILDVVYNHLGPEGNYLHAFGPYFTDRYRTPWGDAINFDGPDSDPVRNYFITNALYWISEFHIDALRLDAVHGIYDFSARHILQELAEEVHCHGATLGRRIQVIAESDLNDVRITSPTGSGGYGLDAQWNDDFHHALRTLLTGDRSGYYIDFGDFSHLAKAVTQGFVLDGTYSAYRRRRHGNSSKGAPPSRLIIFSQNHDQLGNRMKGERLHEHLSPDQLKLAASLVLLSPQIPLLFMGEEYADPAPFPYFVSHGDPGLVEAVREGRCREFAGFAVGENMPDPQDEKTFNSAKIDPGLRLQGFHEELFRFYRELISLRKSMMRLFTTGSGETAIAADNRQQVLTIRRSFHDHDYFCVFNFSDGNREIVLPQSPCKWRIIQKSSVGVTNLADESLEIGPFGVAVCAAEVSP